MVEAAFNSVSRRSPSLTELGENAKQPDVSTARDRLAMERKPAAAYRRRTCCRRFRLP